MAEHHGEAPENQGAAEPASGWIARRSELDERIRELHARNEELARRLIRGEEAEGRAGSTPAQVKKAEAFARMSHARAMEAYRRAAIMRLHSASAHERAADTYERLGVNGEASVSYRDRAAMHRERAAADRSAASDLLRAYESELRSAAG